MSDPLERLIAPLSRARFLAEHWDQRSAALPGDLDRFSDLYDLAAWTKRAHLVDVDAATQDEAGAQRQVRVGAERIDECYAAGMTICADASTHPGTRAFLEAFQHQLRVGDGQAFAKLYASPPGAGFAMHMDAHHVFVVQLSGSKRWHFSANPAVSSPLCGAKVDHRAGAVLSFPRSGQPCVGDKGEQVPVPTLDELETADLTPGDVLYLPPGAWHATKAVHESVAISISPPRQTPVSLLVRALERLAERDPSWRRDIMTLSDPPPAVGHVTQTVERVVAERLGELQSLDPRLIHRLWSIDVNCGQSPSPDATQPVALRRAHHLKPAGGKRTRFITATELGEEKIFIYCRGAEFSLPIEALQFVQRLAQTDLFRADDVLKWDPQLDWDTAREVLAQLLSAGILVRSE